MLSIEIVAEDLLFPEGPVVLSDGSLLVVELGAGCVTSIAPSGRKSVIARTGGGPNGAAIGPDGGLYVCNNGGSIVHRENGVISIRGQAADYQGGSIQRVDLDSGRVDVLYTACGGYRLKAPNDLVFDRHGGFYFTDMGRTRARDRDRGGVYYAQTDGTCIKEVIYPMHTPNGIGLSPDEETLYVAETETARLWAFDVVGPGELRFETTTSPNGGRMVMAAGAPYQRFDSLAVQQNGEVCIATLDNGGVTCVDPATSRWRHIGLPDRLTTNLCFGGEDNMTAWVTLSSSGRLGRTPWSTPGLTPNFSTWGGGVRA